jgi:hypothetical protein
VDGGQPNLIRSASFGRGLFRIWLVLSCIWVAVVGTMSFWAMSSNPNHLGPRPPQECVNAKTAEECFAILEKLGKNPFEAFGTLDNGPIFYGQPDNAANKIFPIARLALLPPALVLIIGAGFAWALRGFRPRQ